MYSLFMNVHYVKGVNMIIRLVRLIIGLNVYAFGLFWTWVVLWKVFFTAITRGSKGITKLFFKKEHSRRPRVAVVGFEHDYVRTKSGLRFHFVHAGNYSQPLMLCLHGFPECWYSWKNILRDFGSDYHVVAIDMRGFGDSNKPKGVSQYHIDYLTKDVREIIFALDYKEAVLVGHDWGGVVACQVAHVYPEVVRKLVVMNAVSLSALFSYALFHPKQILASWYVFLYQIPFIPEWLVSIDDYKPVTHYFKGRGEMGIKNLKNCLSDEEIEIYKNASSIHIRYGINYYRALNPIYCGLNLKKRDEKITRPTLMIWGSEDKALNIGLVSHMNKYVKNMRTVVIDGASHWVGLDEPERVTKAIAEFLEITN